MNGITLSEMHIGFADASEPNADDKRPYDKGQYQSPELVSYEFTFPGISIEKQTA